MNSLIKQITELSYKTIIDLMGSTLTLWRPVVTTPVDVDDHSDNVNYVENVDFSLPPYWKGLGSLQDGSYLSSHQPLAELHDTTRIFEIDFPFVAYLPYVSMPLMKDMLEDSSKQRYRQIKPPIDVNDLHIYWMLSLANPLGGYSNE